MLAHVSRDSAASIITVDIIKNKILPDYTTSHPSRHSCRNEKLRSYAM